MIKHYQLVPWLLNVMSDPDSHTTLYCHTHTTFPRIESTRSRRNKKGTDAPFYLGASLTRQSVWLSDLTPEPKLDIYHRPNTDWSLLFTAVFHPSSMGLSGFIRIITASLGLTV